MNSIRRGLSVFLILFLLTSLTGPRAALAATPRMSDAQAVSLLQSFGIVKGDPSGSLLLDERLTRAQAAALFVRSMGAEAAAASLRDSADYADTIGHWASGEIAMAGQLGLMKGDGDGTFRPNADITYAEILTVMLRMIGREPQGKWDRALIAASAAEIGILPEGVTMSEPAIRQKVFWALGTTISTVPLPSGKTVLQERIDPVAPELSLDDVPSVSDSGTITVAGLAIGAAKVTVQNKEASFDRNSYRFSASVNLEIGRNTVIVEATDLAGNKTSRSVTTERRPRISRLEISGPTLVRSGSSVKLTVTGYDAQNQPVAVNGLEASMTGDLATYNVATSTLTAGNKTGRGTLTLRAGSASATYRFDVTAQSTRAAGLQFASINGGVAPSAKKEVSVQVQVLDSQGKLVTDDYWRPITLTASGLSGVTINPATVQTEGGIATFKVTGSTDGLGTLTAVAANLDGAVTSIQFITGTRVVLTSSPTSLKPDGVSTATITATLQDENGRTMSNTTNSDIQVVLNAAGTDTVLTDTTLTIPRGRSNSSSDSAALMAGIRPGSVTVTGSMASAHAYSVQALSMPINGQLAGVKLQLTLNTPRPAPNGSPAQVTVRVLDAQNRVVTAGAYAFQIEVSTSNREAKVGGLPQGVGLTFADSSYFPVNDGLSPSDPHNNTLSVVGRTHNGVANLNVRYDKSGIVTLTPVLVTGSDSAYHTASGFGKAISSLGMAVEPLQVTFAGNVAGVRLTVDSGLGQDQPGGAVQGVRTMKLRARVVDDTGSPVPGYNGNVTLTRTGGNAISTIVGPRQVAAVNGVAEFTVTSNGPVGYDSYTASISGFSSNPVSISVRERLTVAPSIVAIRGGKNDDPSPITGYVAPDADYMEIQLDQLASPTTGEPHHWVTAKVYRKGESSPFFTSGVFDLNSALPIVRIPKSSLQRSGQYFYEVVINNGASDSPRSAETPVARALNAVYNPDYKIVSATYDAETGRLFLETRSLAYGGSPDPASFTLYKEDGPELVLAHPTVEVQSFTTTSLILKLGDLAEQITPDRFSGTVLLAVRDGWFFNSDGSQVAKATTTPVQVKPMGVISHAVLDSPMKKLYLYGSGFDQGTITIDQIAIEDGTTAVRLRPNADSVSSKTQTTLTVTLSNETLKAIQELPGASAYVTAATGWLRLASGGNTYKSGAIAGEDHLLYVQVTANSASYDKALNQLTINGSAFDGATLVPTKLIFRPTATQTPTWSPSPTAVVTVESSSTIRIQLSDADASSFENYFGGKSVFLNADTGWLLNAAHRPAAPIPTNNVRFSVP